IDIKAPTEGSLRIQAGDALDDSISKPLQSFHRQLAHVAIVFDDEDAFAFGWHFASFGSRWPSRIALRPASRRVEIDGRPLTGLAIYCDMPVRLLDEAVDGAEPEPCSTPDWFGGEERLEDTAEDHLRHASTVVGDRDSHILAGL